MSQVQGFIDVLPYRPVDVAQGCKAITHDSSVIAGQLEDFVKGKIVLMGCPKLDDAEHYREKLTQMFKQNNIKSILCPHMEVPCCFGLPGLIREAIAASNKHIPFHDITITVKGGIKE